MCPSFVTGSVVTIMHMIPLDYLKVGISEKLNLFCICILYVLK